MKSFYIHILIKNKVLFSTLPEELREEAEKSEYIYKNCICPIKRIMKRQNKEAVQDGYIYMCSYDTSMTSKIFSYYFDMLKTIHIAYQEKVKNIELNLIKDIRRLQHNVNTYNATIQDEITNLVPLDDIHNNYDYTYQVLRSLKKDYKEDIKTVKDIEKKLFLIDLNNKKSN